jgi:hypothetical protein
MKQIVIIFLTLMLSVCSTKPASKVEFTIDPLSPRIPIGEIELQFDNTFPMRGLRKVSVPILYFPIEDAVGIRYRHEFITYYQCWDESGRETFIKALDNYYIDYGARNLGRNTRGRKYQYGIAYGFLMWQTHEFSERPAANMEILLGYYFRDNAPYFCITQKETAHISSADSNNITRTKDVPMYFTRAQALELAKLFDPQFINNIKQGAESQIITPSSDAARDYYESENQQTIKQPEIHQIIEKQPEEHETMVLQIEEPNEELPTEKLQTEEYQAEEI